MDKIVCLGKNYLDHIKELSSNLDVSPPKNPTLFIKPPSNAVFIDSQASQDIYLDFSDGEVHHEVELVFLLKDCQKISNNQVHHYIEGYSLGIDFTKRDLQKYYKDEGMPWSLSKCFPSSAVILAPFKQVPNDIDTILNKKFILEVNGQVKQMGNPQEMINDPFKMISHVSKKLPFIKGDLFFTGTPKGVGPVTENDEVKFYFEDSPKDCGVLTIRSDFR